MRATSAPHPPQLSLPGQAHVAEGPLDMSAMYVMHHAFRRDLEAFCTAVTRTPVDDAATWAALAARWERFGMVLHHHHRVEDETIWPPLLARVDAGGRETLEAMQAEHATIDPVLAACTSGFAALVAAPGEDARSRLVEQLTAARHAIDRHLAHEETGALPLVQRHMSAAEWATAEKTAQRSFALRDLAFLLPWAAAGLDRATRDRAFATAGPSFRVLYRLTRGRFERSEAAALRRS